MKMFKKLAVVMLGYHSSFRNYDSTDNGSLKFTG